MRVRNFIIENRNLFMDTLEKELCIYGISYVRINNEIHFLDQIIRFYDIEKDKLNIINEFFIKEYNIQEIKIPTLLEMDMISLIKKYPIIDVKYLHHFEMKNNTSFQKRNYKIQQQESHKVKQQLKRFSK